MIHRPSLAAIAALFVAFSPAALAQAGTVRASKEASTAGPWQVDVRGGTGLGSFQDIQVPVNELSNNQRGDGTLVADENQTHTGFPLMAGIGLDWQATDGLRWELLGLDGLQMRASTGPADTQSSSYSRLGLATKLAYKFPLGGFKGEVGGSAGLRRSSWSNVSTGHYVNAALVEGQVGIEGASASLQLYGGAAPVAHFGYSTTMLGGRDFKKSTASLNEVGARLSFPLRPHVWLDTGIEREETRVTISDVSEYNNFGLSVFSPDAPTRSYDLVTTVAKIGFHKTF